MAIMRVKWKEEAKAITLPPAPPKRSIRVVLEVLVDRSWAIWLWRRLVLGV